MLNIRLSCAVRLVVLINMTTEKTTRSVLVFLLFCISISPSFFTSTVPTSFPYLCMGAVKVVVYPHARLYLSLEYTADFLPPARARSAESL